MSRSPLNNFALFVLLPLSASLFHCGSDDSDSPPSSSSGGSANAGAGGQSGEGGSAGSGAAGSGGSTGGSAGSSAGGTAGSSGAAGSAGTGATAGAGGAAGTSGTSGSAGVAGSGGSGASAGTGGNAGVGGTGGSGGMPTCDPSQSPVFALSSVNWGDGNSGEWKHVGFNIDGLFSTGTSTDVCQPNAGAPPLTPYPDGDNGIDNSFGKNILPLLLGVLPTLPSDVNQNINSGVSTSLIKIDCLPESGDAPALTTKAYSTTSLNMIPKWDSTDAWPVKPEFLSDPLDPESSTLVFEQSSVVASQFDSGTGGSFVLSIPMQMSQTSAEMRLTIHHARVTMFLDQTQQNATIGMIGGVLNTEELVAEMNKVGMLAGLCGNPLLDSVILSIRQASDILANGTQSPEQTCDGISIGLSFEAKRAQIGGVGPTSPVFSGCN